MISLKNVCSNKSSSIAMKDLEFNDGEYPIYGASGFIKNVDFYKQEKPYIAVVKDGAGVGRIMKLPAKSSIIGTMQYIIPNENMDISYLAYAMENMNLSKYYSGATIPHIYFKDYCNEKLPNYTVAEQHQIAKILDKVTDLIDKHKKQLQKLDELVKARFVEMFGDPVSNPYGWEKISLCELADIKIGPFGSLIHKEEYIEGGYALINPSNIIDGKISIDTKLTVSKIKYDELNSYHLRVGDLILGRRGEMGRCAIVEKEGLICGTGSLRIRTKGKVTSDYLQKIISFPSFKKTIEDMAVGQTMPNLNVSIVSGFQIIMPPLEVQQQYYSFIELIDGLKTQIQENIEKIETLKKALMQKYFE